MEVEILLLITLSAMVMGLGLVNFRRAKIMTAAFVGVLLLQVIIQVMLRVADSFELFQICGIANLLIFIPSIGFFIFAACRDRKHWLALSAAGAGTIVIWFFIGLYYFACRCFAT